MKNIFCDQSDLRNEASVESLFVDRLIHFFGYPDNRVRRKESIENITIGRGSKKEKYRPDYVLLDSNGGPILVVDAKAPKENVRSYHYQVSSYALYLNQKIPDRNPVLYTVLTNGNQFVVYPWDSEQPVFFLRFEDFVDGNEKFLELRSNLSYSAFNQAAATKGVFDFTRPGITNLIRTFNECHDLIWKKEKISPTDAFYEFCKIMFIKIKEDNRIHSIIDKGIKPKATDFVFSTGWIERESMVEPNPFNSILFRHVQEDLERQIQEKKKKRIFEKGEGLTLKPSTTFEVVKKLQNYDLYGIDEDLNGRMFETFLNATVRGKDLGQFFTPRGVVHYMVECAPLFISPDKALPMENRIPTILDGCCGSGGFLIDGMATIVHSINKVTHFTDKERKTYIDSLQNNHLFGIEANLKIAKIARLNMYLHGDGGSKIFKADTLDKELITEPGMSDEEKDDINELRKYLGEENIKFDVILTNPPFSMKYKLEDSHESRILQQYTISKGEGGAQSSSEKSNVLFIERYLDLLKPSVGELITVIDDTVLNGDSSQRYRDYILEHFIIVQIVSLPFNTFFRAGANIKTSLVHLRRRTPNEKQGSVFMAITNNIGHNDHQHDTPERNNLPLVSKLFYDWKNGLKLKTEIINNEDPEESLGCPLQIFEVSPDRLNKNRLDAFYYSPDLRRILKELRSKERDGKILLKRGSDFNMISPLKKDEVEQCWGKKFKYFEIGDVTIDGTIVKQTEDYFENLPTRARLKVKAGDVVFAKNNSSRGTTVIIPKWHHEGLVTTGFIGIRPRDSEEGLILWNIFESEFFRKQIYYYSITASQPEIRDTIFRDDIIIPWPKNDRDKQKIITNAQMAEEARNKLKQSIEQATIIFDKVF